MKVKLPKEMRGAKYDRIMPIEMNDLDIEQILGPLFYLVVTGGCLRARIPNDPESIGVYIDKLSQHPDLKGFDGPEGRRLLDRLVRTALIKTGAVGRGKRSEQIQALLPHTLGIYKVGLPAQSSMGRRVDAFLYRILLKETHDDRALRRIFEQIFGQGVIIGSPPQFDCRYDGTTEVDTITRLSLALLDSFDPTPVGMRKKREDHDTPDLAPALNSAMAQDLLRYMLVYSEDMPKPALIHYLCALTSFELFVYVNKIVRAVFDIASYVSTPPPALSTDLRPSPPQLYIDFSGDPVGLSRTMAAGAVRRDLEMLSRYISSALILRQLDRYTDELERSPTFRSEIQRTLGDLRDRPGAEYLMALVRLPEHPVLGPEIRANIRRDERAIRVETFGDEHGDTDEGDDQALDQAAFNAIADGATSDLDRLTRYLLEGQIGRVLENPVRLYWSLGGLTKPYGLLEGKLRGRRAWRYAPSNDLLATWVQLAAIPVEGDRRKPRPIRLQAFLEYMEQRFGILIARPPDEVQGAEYEAAAQENLRAMLRRLRQMGIFRDLSDDFTAQQLIPPYSEEAVA